MTKAKLDVRLERFGLYTAYPSGSFLGKIQQVAVLRLIFPHGC